MSLPSRVTTSAHLKAQPIAAPAASPAARAAAQSDKILRAVELSLRWKVKESNQALHDITVRHARDLKEWEALKVQFSATETQLNTAFQAMEDQGPLQGHLVVNLLMTYQKQSTQLNALHTHMNILKYQFKRETAERDMNQDVLLQMQNTSQLPE